MIPVPGLTFLKNIANMKAEYKCNVCSNIVVRYKSNAKKVLSCGCSVNIKRGQHNSSNTYLYRIYHYFKSNFGKNIEFKNFIDFKNWALANNWIPGKLVVRRNRLLDIVKNNLKIVTREEGIRKARSKSNELTEKQKENIDKHWIKIVTKHKKSESLNCLINLVALLTSLRFCDVYKHITGNNIYNNLGDGRKSYKRAWRIYKNKKEI